MERYRESSVAASTARVYSSAQGRYTRFCRESGSAPWPTSEQVLCRFIAHLADGGIRAASLKCYLAGIRHGHIAGGWGDPRINLMAGLEQVLKGIKLTQAKSGVAASAPKRPITLDVLEALRQVWQSAEGHWDASMLWAASSLCFFGFFRSGELTVPSEAAFDPGAHLAFDDVRVDSLAAPSRLCIRLKASKTDPFRHGVDVFVGKSGDERCPVAAVLNYMIKRKSGPGPFFRFQDGSALTRPRFVAEVKLALSGAGLDSSRYAGHSFRSGAASTAAERGIEDSVIKMLGRWRSSAFQRYIRTPRDRLAGISAVLAKQDSHTDVGRGSLS